MTCQQCKNGKLTDSGIICKRTQEPATKPCQHFRDIKTSWTPLPGLNRELHR